MNSANYNPASQRSGGLYLLVGLLVVMLGFVAVTFYLITLDSRNEQAWMSLTTEVQVLSQQVAKSATEAAEGNLDAFYQLGDANSQMSRAMNTLKSGDSELSIPSLPSAMTEPLGHLSDTWSRMSEDAGKIIEREALILELSEASQSFIAVIPRMQSLTDSAVRELTQSGAPNQQIFIAGRQLILSDRILRHLHEVLRGGMGAMTAADNLEKDVNNLGQMINALLNGSQSLGVTRVGNAKARNAVTEARKIFTAARPDIDLILASSGDLLEVRGAADEIVIDSKTLFDQVRTVSVAIGGHAGNRLWPSLWSGSLALIIILAIVAWLVRSVLSSERNRAVEAGMANQRNQQAILRLLDEMSSLADGDLTVRATVTDDMTGAIADSVNFAVEQLRELVTGINITAQTVAESAQHTKTTTSQLAEASGRQAEQVRAVSETINDMAESFELMADRSRESNEVAQRSVAIAHNGSEMVQQTIKGMDTIRDQIQETSKRIKRLGESSQEIGDIVELINGIAEQTNILALNAAIQSASAGGAGRGFAVVADEVQRLAERATNATRRIEMLVQNIQADTSEAIISMEATTSEVVSGARKAEDAGEALGRIENVSNDLSSLIEDISQEAQRHSETGTRIAGRMNEIRDISIQTSEGTNLTARSLNELADLVRKLSESVADFKLPRTRAKPLEPDS
jgi:twitching motility protein PilJ